MGQLLRQLVLEALTQPKVAAKRLVGINLPKDVIFQLAVIVAILQTITGSLWLDTFTGALPEAERPMVVPLPPILDALIKLGLLYFYALVVEKIGQMFEGTGNFPQAQLIVIFFFFLVSLWFLAMALAMTLVPMLGVLVTLAFVYWTFWALASFVAVLHGFSSVLNTLAGVIVFGMLVLLILLIVSGIILNATGLMPTGAH